MNSAAVPATAGSLLCTFSEASNRGGCLLRFLRPSDRIFAAESTDYVQNNHSFYVLFLCTHNSARSILAGEALLNDMGQGRFKGSLCRQQPPSPTSNPDPLGCRRRSRAGVSVDGLRSKSWDELPQLRVALQMDLIITVCDNAAGEGAAHWLGPSGHGSRGYADPSQGDTSEEASFEAFRQTVAHDPAAVWSLWSTYLQTSWEKARLQSTARECRSSPLTATRSRASICIALDLSISLQNH